jgi:NADPH:quinone reductase-like Zn-dependent oxidoreductase
VERFRVGDRVVTAALAIAKASNDPAEGGFQNYTLVRKYLAAPLPDHINNEQAYIIPLTLYTAAYGLFHPDFLALDLPTVPPRPTTTGGKDKPRAVIITDGSSSVSSNAIQLAVATGYKVLSTSSPKNFDYMKKLGASSVFNYHSITLAKDLLATTQGRTLIGIYTIGNGAVETYTTVLARHPETTHKFIAMAGGSPLGDNLATFTGKVILAITLLWKVLKQAIISRFTGVKVKFIDLKDTYEPKGHMAQVFREYLPRALAERQFVPAPDPVVMGKGLDIIQKAIDIQIKGVSAQKIIISL